MEKNKLTIRIDGREYTVKSEMPVTDIQDVATLVDSKIKEIRKSDSGLGLSTVMVAVLAALNVAEDHVKLKKSGAQHGDEAQKLRETMGRMRQEIDRLKKVEEEYIKLQKDFIRAETILKSRGINLNDKK